jgi:hypothetical protein
MDRVYPNIVPENNLRLPDAVTITHGPRRLLSQFILQGDRAARDIGLHLRLRTDFDEWLSFNKFETARGNWYPIPTMFNHELVEMNETNAFWISGENEHGEIVVTSGGRIFDWTGTSLAAQASALFYGKDNGEPCIVTAEAAHLISGVVLCGGGTWVRPDYRRQHLSRLVPRLCKTYACGRWPIDWNFAYITSKHAALGMPASYGHRHVSASISYPGTQWRDLVIVYSSADEIYDEIAAFMASELAGQLPNHSVARDGAEAEPAAFEHMVTKTSSDGVFQGSNSLS